jgi:hypothetical protein
MKAYAMELLTAPAPAQTSPFVDRRQRTLGPACGPDRRQFADSRDNLPPEIAELSRAIDRYKLVHRRRFITVAELHAVITELGYRR